MRDERDDHLRVAARRAAMRPFFLARDLTEFRTLHGLGEGGLAAWLGCAQAELPRLALCRRPAPQSSLFRRDVHRIAARAGIEPERLAQLLREVDAADAFHRPGASRAHGMLLAARDRTEDPPDP